MEILESGRNFDFVLLIAILVIMYIAIFRASKGKVPTLRKLPFVDAIDNIIGRCVEMGRPLTFSAGEIRDIQSSSSTLITAALSVFGYVARESVKRGAILYVYTDVPGVYLLEQEILRQAYVAEGKPEEYRSERVVPFLAGQGKSMKLGIMGFAARIKPAGSIITGVWLSSPPYIVECMAEQGAMQICGGTGGVGMSVFAALSDFAIIGEENYALGAYLSRDPLQLANIAGKDYVKLVLLAILVIGFVLASIGSSALFDLLSW